MYLNSSTKHMSLQTIISNNIDFFNMHIKYYIARIVMRNSTRVCREISISIQGIHLLLHLTFNKSHI